MLNGILFEDYFIPPRITGTKLAILLLKCNKSPSREYLSRTLYCCSVFQAKQFERDSVRAVLSVLMITMELVLLVKKSMT